MNHDNSLERPELFAPNNSNSNAPKVSQPLITAAAWSWRFLLVVAAIVVISFIALTFYTLLISTAVAMLIAVVMQPMVTWLHKRGIPNSLAAGLVLLLLLAILLVMFIGSAFGFYSGFSELGSDITQGVNAIIEYIGSHFPDIKSNLSDIWDQVQETIMSNSGQIASGVLSVSSSITEFGTGAAITIFTLFFFLKDGRIIWHWVVRLFPEYYRDDVNESGIRAWVTMGNFTRTQAIVAFVDALGITVIALLLSTPITLAIPIGTIVFLASFIPIIGALVSGIVAVLVVLVNTSSFTMALIMLAGVIAVQQIEGNVLQPVLQGNALNLHALAVVFIVAGGTTIGGIVGAIFSVPLAAAINTVVLYLRGHDIYPYLNSDPDRPGGPRRAFIEFTTAHWEDFDENVAQHESPKELKRMKRDRKRRQSQNTKTEAPKTESTNTN
ncbi:MAG: AI-2E family transporter [Arcanobacterium sp.]|nr:AI-2E family transporter [Arcanobacterium sp.]